MLKNKCMPVIKSLIPPLLYGWYVNKVKKIGYGGNYKSWQDALAASTGYGNDDILKKVRGSLSKVLSGEAKFERDSVVFYQNEYNYFLISCLLLYLNYKKLDGFDLIDFGGSLGSTYFQHLDFLKTYNYTWNIIEQKDFVDAGRKLIKDGRLHFFYDLKEYLAQKKSEIILFSSSLQYLENYQSILEDVFAREIGYIIIDKTPFYDGQEDVITKQNVPGNIYRASYPLRIFSRNILVKKIIDAGYEQVFEYHEEIPHLNYNFPSAVYRGFLFKRI